MKVQTIHKTMLSYCLKCRKNTEIKNPKFAAKKRKKKNERIIILSKYVVCDSKKSKFIKQKEAGGLLSNLGTKTSLSKIPLVGPLLF